MRIPVDLRDSMIDDFRSMMCERMGIVPFEHQAQWWALTRGQVMQDHLIPGTPTEVVRLKDGDLATRSLLPRQSGRARVVAELGAYKIGKSFGAALWAAAFAAVPDARVYLVGIEYDMCAPEFEYLLQFLLSDSFMLGGEQHKGLKLPFTALQNRPKDGRLWLELANGARFEARSWERNESLKGKEVDCYIFCEAYQLPGLECFTSVKQNLRARQGYAVFPTTPDNPWVAVFHENGHDHPEYPEWACHCGVPASVNPYTYDHRVEVLDQKLMTREKFSIAYLGKIGSYVGRVYNYQRGERLFTPASHPHLWHDPNGAATKANFHLPANWTVQTAADTGTYWGAVISAFDEDGTQYVLDELPNYWYVGDNTIELEPDTSMAKWADEFKRRTALWATKPLAWVDPNCQFKQEFWTQYGIHLVGNTVGREARTEASRAYFHNDRIFLAPWLRLLPKEIENAQWPPEATATGRLERIKRNDHLLDCLEHLSSRHPIGRKMEPIPLPGYPTHHVAKRAKIIADPHMGAE